MLGRVLSRRAACRVGVVVSVFSLGLGLATLASAQVFERERSVGGISIDPQGMLEAAQPDAMGRLAEIRSRSIDAIPAELNQAATMRKISLRKLEAAIEQSRQSGEELPDEIQYLGGLQRIEYVLVYPQQQDIVLVGPGEGWKVDAKGNVVGVTTGRPVMLLDDLLVALRSARQAAQGGVSCSIDPTPEGMARVQNVQRSLSRMGNPAAVRQTLEQAMGPQKISVHGVPASSHFARVLVAADYRMKRLAMKFDPSPVRGLPSYLDMLSATSRGMSTPRWWLEPRYEPLLHSPDGLAWQLRGAGVKAMTEEDFFAANGQRQQSVKAGALAQRWADKMTEHYEELAIADPIFGELRNCMELAIVAALIVKEQLPEKAGYSMPTLLDASAVAAEEFPAPKQVATKVNMIRQRGGWVISASGGVMINSWAIADKKQSSEKPQKIHAKATPTGQGDWWRN